MASLMPSSSVFTAAFVGLLGLYITQTIISVFFGPLSKYPGSKLAAATRWISSRHKMNGTEHLYVNELHRKYGPIVRIGPSELSFTDSSAWKEIYGRYTTTDDGVKIMKLVKPLSFYTKSPPGYVEIINAEDAPHTKMRRNLSTAFTEKALRQQEPLIRKYIDQLMGVFMKRAKDPGNQLDLKDHFNWCLFDVMADLTSGEPFGCLSKEDYHPWISKLFAIVRIIPFVVEINTFPWLALLVDWITPASVQKDFMAFYEFSRDLVRKRLARSEVRPDIWGAVLNAKEEYHFTEPEMYGTSKVLLVAGTETSATLLCGLHYYLLQDAERLARLVHEVRSTFSSALEINGESVSRLPYLNACIEESLRIYPPAAGYLPRVVPKGGATVCGEYVPAGVTLYVHQYAANHQERNFKDPDKFVPERWLKDPAYANDNLEVVQPFSVGPRNCIGKTLAYLEIRLIIANLMWHFDLSSRVKGNWLNQRVFTLWEKGPLMVNLKPVQR